MNRTTRDTVRSLCKSVLNRLESTKFIDMIPQNRTSVSEDLFQRVQPLVYTDEDLHDMTVEMVGESIDETEGKDITENEQYRIARTIVKKKYGTEELNGFYFQHSIKAVAEAVTSFLMDCDMIDDVFESDENIERSVVQIIKNFNPKNIH